MEFKALIKNTSYMMVARITQFSAGLVTTKMSAIILGTIGVGIVNQLTFLTQKMSQFTTLSMVEAVVKQIAENKTKDEASEIINSAFKSYIVLVSTFLVISIFLLFVFANTLTKFVFGDNALISYFYIGVFTFPLLIISSIPFAILKGFRDIRLLSRIRIGIVFSNLIFAIPLIYFYKLNGAVAYVPISYFVNLTFHLVIANKYYFKKFNINFYSIFHSKFRKDFVKELFYFSGFGITVGTYAIFSEFTCRSIVVSNLGVEAIGLYSPIVMWASILTGFLLPSLSTYLYPRFCEIKSKTELSGLINDALRLGTIVIIPLIFIGIPFRFVIITLFYSHGFIQAASYLPYHFFGLIFYVWWYIFTQAMTPTGRIKQHGIFQIMFFSLDIAVTYYFVNKFGLYGWMLKFIISPFVFFFVYSIYSYKRMGFRLSSENILLMVFLLISTIILIMIINFFNAQVKINYFVGPTLLIGSYLFLKEGEKIFIQNKIQYIKSFFTKK